MSSSLPPSTSASRPAKARRGPISCAECRRLKIKCDRIVPCTPCQKRGCASLCPDGSLVSKGSRYILSDTEALHRKIEELTLRVRELEKGLEEERAAHTSEKHPLLDDALVSIAAPPTQADHAAEAEDGPISSFGTLLISSEGGVDGGVKWLGSTAVAAWFLDDEAEREPLRNVNEMDLPLDLMNICNGFPFGNVLIDDLTREKLYSFLPLDEAEAYICVDRYFLNIAWLYNFVPIKVLKELVRLAYDPSAEQISPHRLAILYLVFALNTLIDEHPRPGWLPSHTYSELGRAALGVENVFGNNATLSTVQALALLSYWYQLADDSGDPSKSWGCLGLTFKVAQSIGLHRDGKKWNLTNEEIMDRRRVFWELQALDVWQAMGYGRPPSLVRPHFDCPQPFDTEETLGHMPHFHRWKHHYISEGIMNIMEQALISSSSTTPTHATILKLDTKVRSCAIPAKLKDLKLAAHDEMLLLQHYTSMLSRESALMYLHRGFFARAVFDLPNDPLRNKFAHSVLAVHTSACQVLKWLREVFDSYPQIVNRIFGWWGHAMSSAVTLGGLVAMAPNCSLAEQALKEFDKAVELLRRGLVGPKARKILPSLETLHSKAHLSFEQYQAGTWKPDMSKKLAPSADMPGLGAAVLPLPKNISQSPQPSPPPESPSAMEIQPAEQLPGHMHHNRHLSDSIPWFIDPSIPIAPAEFPISLSPQDLMLPPRRHTIDGAPLPPYFGDGDYSVGPSMSQVHYFNQHGGTNELRSQLRHQSGPTLSHTPHLGHAATQPRLVSSSWMNNVSSNQHGNSGFALEHDQSLGMTPEFHNTEPTSFEHRSFTMDAFGGSAPPWEDQHMQDVGGNYDDSSWNSFMRGLGIDLTHDIK